VAYANKGSFDLAIADYSKVGELDPKNVDVSRALAWIYLYQGKPALAHQKAAAYLELNGLAGDNAPYAIIVGYLGLLKSGESAKSNEFLSGWVKQVKEDAWTTKIIRYFHGEITAAQLLALATDNDKLTEAHAYIGEIQLINKATDTAKVHFEWVRNNGDKSFFEYTLAIAELKRLSQ
jgi:lipoprotein NlpI